jgi:hypothetical protein
LVPYSTSGIEGPLSAGLPTRYVPPSGFGYPLDGLLPSYPAPVLFRTSSAHGIHPSERSPPTRCPVRFRPGEPTCRFTCRCSRRRSGRPARQASAPGFRPCKRPWRSQMGLALRALEAPVGFALLGSAGKDIDRDFSRSPLMRFAKQANYRPPTGASEYRSVLAWPHPLTSAGRVGKDRATLLGFSHRLDPKRSSARSPGLWVHLSPRRTSLPTGWRSLDEPAALYRSRLGSAEVPSIRRVMPLLPPWIGWRTRPACAGHPPSSYPKATPCGANDR